MRSGTRAGVVGLLMVAVLGLDRPIRAAEPLPASLLRVVQGRAGTAYRGEQIVATTQGGEAHVTLGRVWHDPPEWTRVEYTPVGTSRRWVVVRRGSTQIQYDPVTLVGTRSVHLVGDDQETLLTTPLPWLLENYRVTAAPGLLLGRVTDRVVISPIAPDRPTRRMDVDRATGVVLRWERVGPRGRLDQVTTFLSFEVMPKGWMVGTDLPRGLRLTDRPNAHRITLEEAARRLDARPARVRAPKGFHEVAHYLVQDRSPALQAVFSDGLSVLVVTMRRGNLPRPPKGSRLVQTVGGPVWVLRSGGSVLVHWASGPWLLTMVGDLVPDLMIQTAVQTGIADTPRAYDYIEAWLKSLF